jgi:hypothetical protein
MQTRIEVRNEETGAPIIDKTTDGVFSIVQPKDAKECYFGKLADGSERLVLAIPQGWAYGVTVNVPRDLIMVTVAVPAADLAALAVEYKITEQSLDLFVRYAKDGGNWSGQPMIGGNVGGSKEDRGNLTQLKRAKLIATSKSDGCDWIQFLERGLELAAKLGIDTGN